MTSEEQIDHAIGKHGMWKAHLRSAIDSGESEFNPKMVRKDDECEFGKWLHGEMPDELKRSATYTIILNYHKEFHAEASRILQLALDGHVDEAEKAMSLGSKFSSMSAALTTSMLEWKKGLHN